MPPLCSERWRGSPTQSRGASSSRQRQALAGSARAASASSGERGAHDALQLARGSRAARSRPAVMVQHLGQRLTSARGIAEGLGGVTQRPARTVGVDVGDHRRVLAR